MFVVTTGAMVGEAKKALAPSVTSICEQDYCLMRSKRELPKAYR